VKSVPHTAHQCIAHHITALHYTALHCTSLHITSLHITSLHITSLHCISLHITSHHCTALHCTALHCTSHHITSHHITALHCTALSRTHLHRIMQNLANPVKLIVGRLAVDSDGGSWAFHRHGSTPGVHNVGEGETDLDPLLPRSQSTVDIQRKTCTVVVELTAQTKGKKSHRQTDHAWMATHVPCVAPSAHLPTTCYLW
jgi:hypothetical protein